MKRYFIHLLFFLTALFLMNATVKPVLATKYDLIAPSGQLSRGQEVKFTITIDTETKAISTAQIGMNYKTDALQYVSAVPGTTFTNITVTPQTGGNLLIAASNASPYSGTGDLAYITFKIIATAPGSTDLCVLYAPTTTPAPTTVVPTALPKTGQGDMGAYVSFAGFGLLGATAVLLIVGRKSKHVVKHHPHHTKGS